LWGRTPGSARLALDDSINAKSGRKVFACQRSFHHAAKVNQSQYPWAQTLVTGITAGKLALQIPTSFVFIT
jgi:hypothetical protein